MSALAPGTWQRDWLAFLRHRLVHLRGATAVRFLLSEDSKNYTMEDDQQLTTEG